jgi:phosphopantothenoylcysteine synthetase/decarboxylase
VDKSKQCLARYTRRVDSFDTLYLVITGAGAARRIPALLPQLTPLCRRTLVIPTPNSRAILSPRELVLAANCRIVESYFDAAILPRPERGVVLVAPCDFNSLNKLAQGIADNLALSVTAEAIGRGTPVVVAISVNSPLWAHPRAQQSAATLRSWGCRVLDPVPSSDTLTLVPDSQLVAAVSGWLMA